jgi:hypothetical protein
MGWSLGDLGIAGVTVIGVVPSLIIVGVLFLIGYIAMVALGIVSAVIYTLAGVGVLWIISLFGVFKKMWSHPYVLLLFLILPIAFLWGYGTDHIKGLTVLAPAQLISSQPSVTVQQMSLQGQAVSFIITPQFFGGILLGAGIVIALISLPFVTKKKKRRR